MKAFRAVILLACFVFAGGNASAATTEQKPDSSTNDQPEFAAGWRVSGILRQGGKVQASLEHPKRSPRFVREGDEFSTGVIVEKIDAVKRTVLVRHENQTAVIRPGPAPYRPKTNTAASQSASSQPQQTAQQGQQPQQPRPWQRGPGTAGQDEQGRWGVRLGDGTFSSAQDYAKRFGGVEKAIEHSYKHMEEVTEPEHREYHVQMLSALKNFRDSGQAAP